ncbi:fatty acid desaturase family protein [Lichenicoccus sp.]|uniref:fatty acid desaturase family protein n=1 Tax=Lichenicoccus sp. TaxID=2781899 RepID=UPI003D0F39EC
MYASLTLSVWLTLLLAIPASGLIVRIFMLQHDCGHGSLFRSRRMNSIVGAACSLVTLTPFAYWRRLHARHHASWNNLDGRGVPADFFSDCLTLAEYRGLGPMARRVYRVTHHPALVHLLLPPVVFILLYRLPFDTPAICRRERLSVALLDLSLVCVFAGLVARMGWADVALVHLPALALAAIVGIWLFSVQHRFEDSQWARTRDWKFEHASLHGASYLKLPRVLQWFSGNIGLHHVHHLRPGVPNYRLQACHDACGQVTDHATILTLGDALRAPSYALWDEVRCRMIPIASALPVESD